MKKAKALHPVPKPRPKPKARHHGPRQAVPPHSTGSASHLAAPPPGSPAHHAKPGKPKRPKPKRPVRKLALGEAVACCSAEAVAMSLRLATDFAVPVTDPDVLALYFATADGPDDGASIEDTLDAVARYGVAGRVPGRSLARAYPAAAGECTTALYPWTGNAAPNLILGLDDFTAAACLIEQRAGAGHVRAQLGPGALRAGRFVAAGRPCPGALDDGEDEVIEVPGFAAQEAHGLILGLDLPEGPHAVLATPDGWWSWGELYDPSEFPGAVVEEAWAVTWS